MTEVKKCPHMKCICDWLMKYGIYLLLVAVVLIGIKVFFLCKTKSKKRPHDIKKVVAQKLSKQKKRR